MSHSLKNYVTRLKINKIQAIVVIALGVEGVLMLLLERMFDVVTLWVEGAKVLLLK